MWRRANVHRSVLRYTSDLEMLRGELEYWGHGTMKMTGFPPGRDRDNEYYDRLPSEADSRDLRAKIHGCCWVGLETQGWCHYPGTNHGKQEASREGWRNRNRIHRKLTMGVLRRESTERGVERAVMSRNQKGQKIGSLGNYRAKASCCRGMAA